MESHKILLLFIFFVLALTTSFAAPTTNHGGAAPLRYSPGSFAAVLDTIAKDSHGALRLSHDGILHSFAANGSVIDSRPLDVSRSHGIALGREGLHHPRDANMRLPPTLSVPPPGIRLEGMPGMFRPQSTDPAHVDPARVDPEILGVCNPPLACHNSTQSTSTAKSQSGTVLQRAPPPFALGPSHVVGGITCSGLDFAGGVEKLEQAFARTSEPAPRAYGTIRTMAVNTITNLPD
ncbi:hypothetical protein G7Z17_g4520 [Cylindrodendrum hubeiense]|uniref:Uncharacterized protein n=1 Tax=Cylindrodendrum hubeiense TaxID=595255 RepID=A0A9P5L9W2_9HYPO|nr:hypothetical protein G7Z17_g4520 [Cylindrodendrum hubeiense]